MTIRHIQLLAYTLAAAFSLTLCAWGQKPQQDPTPIFTGSSGPVTLQKSRIFSNEDEHGCNYAFVWDAAKSICTIRLRFPADVVCEKGATGSELVCSYKPKPTEVSPKK